MTDNRVARQVQEAARPFTSESRATRPTTRLDCGQHRFCLHSDGLWPRPGLYANDDGFNADEGRADLTAVLQLEILDATDAESCASITRRPAPTQPPLPSLDAARWFARD